MSWVRLDDGFPLHTKFHAAGVEAFGWWTAAVAYCNRELTDGFVPARAWGIVYPGLEPELIAQLVDRLVIARLLHPVDPGQFSACNRRLHPGCPRERAREKGVFMHDYFDFQPTRAAILQQRVARSAAGRQGGVNSGLSRKQVASTLLKRPLEANRKHPANPLPSPPNLQKERTTTRDGGYVDNSTPATPTDPPPAGLLPQSPPTHDRRQPGDHALPLATLVAAASAKARATAAQRVAALRAAEGKAQPPPQDDVQPAW